MSESNGKNKIYADILSHLQGKLKTYRSIGASIAGIKLYLLKFLYNLY